MNGTAPTPEQIALAIGNATNEERLVAACETIHDALKTLPELTVGEAASACMVVCAAKLYDATAKGSKSTPIHALNLHAVLTCMAEGAAFGTIIEAAGITPPEEPR